MKATGFQNVANMEPTSVRIGIARSKGGGISVSAFFFSTWVPCPGLKIVFIFRLVFLMVFLKFFWCILLLKWSLQRIGFRYFLYQKKNSFLIALSLFLEGLFGALILENERLAYTRGSLSSITAPEICRKINQN